MRDHRRQLEAAIEAWRQRDWPAPSVLVVSGSGLAVDLDGDVKAIAELAEIVPFPLRTIAGHPHQVELLETEHGIVLYQRGRIHSYQGYSANETVFVVRLAALLGAATLVMTNAAGGVSASQPIGQMVAIRDQLNLTGLNPLRGELPPEWGPQFPDMVDAYDPELLSLANAVAADLGIELGSGIYAGLAGPSFETAAEVTMLQRLGADLVGMSTVLEVIAARHLGMRCLCFSLVANLAAGLEGAESVDHEEVLATGRAAGHLVMRLLSALLARPELYRARLSSRAPGS